MQEPQTVFWPAKLCEPIDNLGAGIAIRVLDINLTEVAPKLVAACPEADIPEVGFGSWSCENAWCPAMATLCVQSNNEMRLTSGLHRGEEVTAAHNVEDPGQIVGQDMKRHLAGDAWQGLHEEVRCAHASL